MTRFTFSILFLLLASMTATAHFVFVVPQPDGSTASIFISETLDPDPAVDIDLVKDTKLSFRDPAGREGAVSLVKAGNVYSVPIRPGRVGVLHGVTDIGISGPTDKPYLLLYHPKTILGDALDAKTVVGGNVPTELIPEGRPGALTLKLLGRGKPLAGAEVTVLLPDGSEKVVKTNQAGQTEGFTQAGRYGAWARFWEPSAAGERAGKKYGETHHYATLVFTVSASSQASAAARFGTLSQATASFGAVVDDGWLYVYGGHVSPTHSYFVEAVSGRFARMRLSGNRVWENLPGGPGLQGLNLAAYKGKVYRVGGMAPRNRQGEPADNHSVADVARFDPKSKTWEQFVPLPAPRSSHDVAVVGTRLYVVGGWNMIGKDEVFSDTLLEMDLSQKAPSWTPIPQPFKRRALMAAAFDGKLYVVGGMDDHDTVVRTVSVYDPLTRMWSEGPSLPEGTFGFGPAVGVHRGNLVVSVSDGSLFRLVSHATSWEKVASTVPRVAHRLVSSGNSVLILGGADDGKNLDLIESVSLP